jgi:hypothetical protein
MGKKMNRQDYIQRIGELHERATIELQTNGITDRYKKLLGQKWKAELDFDNYIRRQLEYAENANKKYPPK